MQAMLRDVSLVTSPMSCTEIDSVSDHSVPSLVASPRLNVSCCRQLQPIVTLRIGQMRSQLCDRAGHADSGSLEACSMRPEVPSGSSEELDAYCVPEETQISAGFAASILPAVPVTVASVLRGVGLGSTASASSDPAVTAPKVIATMHAQTRNACRCAIPMQLDLARRMHVRTCVLLADLQAHTRPRQQAFLAEAPSAAICSSR